MQIDWFTFGAQIINFLVLVALLRMFLYKPVVDAMNKREERVTSRLEDAQSKEQEAEQEAENYRSQQRELEQAREDLLADAREQADRRRQELIDQAHEEVDDMRWAWQRAIQREKEIFLQRLRTQVSEEVFTVARQALRDLADVELQAQLVRRFTSEIESLDEEQCDKLSRDTDQFMELHSAFELSKDQRDQIDEAVRAQLDGIELRYVTDSDLIAGVALVTDSCQIGWNLHDYLQTLQENLEDLLAEQDLPESEEPDSQEGTETDTAGQDTGEEQVNAAQGENQ